MLPEITVGILIGTAFALGLCGGKRLGKTKRMTMITQFLFQAMKDRQTAILTKMGVYQQPQLFIAKRVSPIGSGVLCFNDSLEHLARLGVLVQAIAVRRK